MHVIEQSANASETVVGVGRFKVHGLSLVQDFGTNPQNKIRKP